jgi:hypothetical protein
MLMIKKYVNNRGSGLLSLLFAVMIIGLMYYFMVGSHKKNGASKDSYLQQMSVDATSYNSMLESAKKAVADSKPKEE